MYGVRRSLRKGRPSMERVKMRVASIRQPKTAKRVFKPISNEFAIERKYEEEKTLKINK
jgi:hypothetical protein